METYNFLLVTTYVPAIGLCARATIVLLAGSLHSAPSMAVAYTVSRQKRKLNYFYKIFLQKRDHLRKRFLMNWSSYKLRRGS